MEKSCLLKMQNITKEFDGIKALDQVSFDLQAGEIHALVGENGAGKSTLMKVLGGVYLPEEGEIYINEQLKQFHSANDALQAGIGIIYQEFNLVHSLSIAENIFLGKELKKHRAVLDRKAMINQANTYMSKLGFDIDCSVLVSTLSVAQQQMVEIVKALFHNSRILVMDEPTAVLTDRESKILFDIMDHLKKSGVGIIYISHRLEEVLNLSDRITVLRDGKFIKELNNQDHGVKKETLVSLMVGRDLKDYYPHREILKSHNTVLEVKNLTCNNVYHNISFSISSGEILGITGLVGAGRTEVVKSIFGAMNYDSGEIYQNGKLQKRINPEEAIKKGIAFIPENRKEESLILDASIIDNMIMVNYNKVSKRGILIKKLLSKFADTYIKELNIKPAEPNHIARNFSGGNQQKAIIAKWLAINPKVLIMDEPTRGIDIGAKAEIYKIMDHLVKQGYCIIMVSSEMPEIIGMCDRVIVMAEGRITGEFSKEEGYDQEKIMAASEAVIDKAG